VPARKTSAWPLAWAYVVLVVYASLYPFGPWRDQGLAPWAYLFAPWSPYWTAFDVVTNWLGYLPLGFLVTLGALRSGEGRWALARGVLAGLAVSAAMESLQSYLPQRVPSNLDLVVNGLGAASGASVAWALERAGLLLRWNRFRDLWFVPDAHGALALLALWPLALLYPVQVPFGLGQVWGRLLAVLTDWLEGTPFMAYVPNWEPLSKGLSPLVEAWCVGLGLLIPGLLVLGVTEGVARRLLVLAWLMGLGLATAGLSAALSVGPAQALAWWDGPTRVATLAAAALLVALAWLPRRLAPLLLIWVLGLYLSRINQIPDDAYFEQTLFSWEQGRFIRFHGVSQWLSWVWPWAVLGYCVAALGARLGKT
jgi:VanZ family protein